MARRGLPSTIADLVGVRRAGIARERRERPAAPQRFLLGCGWRSPAAPVWPCLHARLRAGRTATRASCRAWQYRCWRVRGACSTRGRRRGAFADDYLVALAAADRRDLLALVAYLEHAAPIATGRWRRFTELDEKQQDDVLASIEESKIGLLRGGFQALKALAMMAYYRKPESWQALSCSGRWCGGGLIEQGRQLTADRALEADVVVVGTGAGGGMAASELARRGARVVVLEEGPLLEQPDMSQLEDEMMAKLYQERGGRSTADLAIRVIGGRCIGGSTVHNINLCKRVPPEVLELWRTRHAVSGASEPELRPVFESVERDLSVSRFRSSGAMRTPLAERGVQALGRSGAAIAQSRGCQRTGFCEIGRPYDAKQIRRDLIGCGRSRRSPATPASRASSTTVGWARRRGSASAPTDSRAFPCALAPGGRAGWQRDRQRRVGRRARCRSYDRPDAARPPGIAVAGLFEQRVRPGRASSGYECTSGRFFPGSERRA
jgi:hypothetical protein